MKKRTLSLLLVLALMLSLVPGSAFAADEDFVVEHGVLTAYHGPGGDVVIPDTVTTIPNNSFDGVDRITSVTIPGSVKEINGRAFHTCSALRRVTLAEGVERIQGEAFLGCENLTEVSIPASAQDISGMAFRLTPWLEDLGEFAIVNDILLAYQGSSPEVTVPDGVKEIAAFAFAWNDTITSVTVPDSVQRIGETAFFSCEQLAQVTLPDTLTDFGSSAFRFTPWQTSLGDFAIANGCLLEYQGEEYDVTLPAEVHTLTEGAFAASDSVESVTFPETVTQMAEDEVLFSDKGPVLYAAPGSYAADFIQTQGRRAVQPGTAFTGFTDVPDEAYCARPVLWAVETGITQGTSPAAFSPDRACTQEQVLTFLWRNVGEMEVSDSPYSGTDPLLRWAYRVGILREGEAYSPKAPCTRGQAMLFLWRCVPGKGTPSRTDCFTDVPAGAAYAEAVAWAVETGITDGTSETTFSPYRPCTRGQIMTFLYRALT